MDIKEKTKKKVNYQFISLPKVYKYLNGNEFKLFAILFDLWQYRKDEYGYFFIPISDLKKLVDLANKQLYNAINGLKEKGFIWVKSGSMKYKKANEYSINIEFIQTLIPITSDSPIENDDDSPIEKTITISYKDSYNDINTTIGTSTCSEKNKHRSSSSFSSEGLSDKQLESMVKHLGVLEATDQKQYSTYLKQYQAIISDKANESQKEFWTFSGYPLEEL